MLTAPECLTCILGDVHAAAQLTTDDATALAISRAACSYLAAHFDYTIPPSYHITEVHRILKRLSGQVEPFARRRRQANDVGMQIAARVETQAAALTDPADLFRYLARWALAANSLDSRTAGTGYGFEPAAAFDYLQRYLEREPSVDQIGDLYQRLQVPLHVLYIHDNVGEMALDGQLIQEIRRHGSRVTSAVRGGPITSDATWADAEYLGLHRQADSVILAGPDTLGISLREATPELVAELNQADLVIAKGQANYYVLSEQPSVRRNRVFSLFTVKCDVVCRELGLRRGQTVAGFLPISPPA